MLFRRGDWSDPALEWVFGALCAWPRCRFDRVITEPDHIDEIRVRDPKNQIMLIPLALGTVEELIPGEWVSRQGARDSPLDLMPGSAFETGYSSYVSVVRRDYRARRQNCGADQEQA